MIRCIAIDDEPPALDLLRNYCSRIDDLVLQRTFTRTSEASSFLKEFPVDLLFLDIQMPDISGIEYYKSLERNYQVIFTTAFSDYAVEGFNLNAADYLLKPIKFKRFVQAINKIRNNLNYNKNNITDREQSLFVRSNYKLIKIPFSEINYIEGLDNYIRIVTSMKTVLSHISLKSTINMLPDNMFTRIHRSYIINIHKATSYSNNTVYIEERSIPVGVTYKKTVRELFDADNQGTETSGNK